MKYILSSFGINNPYIVAELPDHAVYPVAVEDARTIDLDYSLLLVGTGFLFDEHALEKLVAEKRRLPFLAPVIRSITRLEEEGFLETFDGKAIIDDQLTNIRAKTELLCEDVSGWLRTVRSQWRVLKQVRENFARRYGSADKRLTNEHNFAVANAVLRIDGKFNQTLLRELSQIVESKRHKFTAIETEYIKEILRPLVSHTVIQDLVRWKTAGAILDWEDSQPYYERLYASRWDTELDSQLAHSARSLFTVSLPELRPQSVDEVIKFIRKNHNVIELRTDINSILERGEKFDEKLGKRLTREVLDAELSIRKKMRKWRLLGAALGLLVPGGSLLTEAAVSGATMGGEDAVDHGHSRPHRWFYSLRG